MLKHSMAANHPTVTLDDFSYRNRKLPQQEVVVTATGSLTGRYLNLYSSNRTGYVKQTWHLSSFGTVELVEL